MAAARTAELLRGSRPQPPQRGDGAVKHDRGTGQPGGAGDHPGARAGPRAQLGRHEQPAARLRAKRDRERDCPASENSKRGRYGGGNAQQPDRAAVAQVVQAGRLGSFKVGENSKIGAGSVVIEEVPPNCTVVGVPGRIVKRNNQKLVREELNQTDLPDPVNEDIKSLQYANSEMTNRILELERQVKQLKKEL